MNKIVYSQFYWDGGKQAIETIREYVSFEFTPEYADDIIEAIGIMEKNHGLKIANPPSTPKKIDVPQEDYGAKKAYNLMKVVDSKLSDRTKKAWRWRILLLRAMFDYELRLSKGVINKKIEAGLQELVVMYYAEKAFRSVRPPAK